MWGINSIYNAPVNYKLKKGKSSNRGIVNDPVTSQPNHHHYSFTVTQKVSDTFTYCLSAQFASIASSNASSK